MRLTQPGGPLPALTPALSPVEVVLAQLDALRSVTGHGATGVPDGVAACFAYASADNQAATGPVARFASLLRSPQYRGLLGHRLAQLGPVQEAAGQARLEVLVMTADDEALGFTWVLSRQTVPPHHGCWMTDGVLRHPDRTAR